MDNMTLEQLKTMLDEKRKKHNEVCKKAYKKKYLKDKETLTEEEQQLKDERIKKRREYMNKRYHDIYKNKK